MTFDYKIIPVQNQDIDSPYRIDGFPKKRKAVTRKFKRDRRKQEKDRRRSVREGIIVDLSHNSKYNRRRGKDRRKIHYSKTYA